MDLLNSVDLAPDSPEAGDSIRNEICGNEFQIFIAHRWSRFLDCLRIRDERKMDLWQLELLDVHHMDIMMYGEGCGNIYS